MSVSGDTQCNLVLDMQGWTRRLHASVISFSLKPDRPRSKAAYPVFLPQELMLATERMMSSRCDRLETMKKEHGEMVSVRVRRRISPTVWSARGLRQWGVARTRYSNHPHDRSPHLPHLIHHRPVQDGHRQSQVSSCG